MRTRPLAALAVTAAAAALTSSALAAPAGTTVDSAVRDGTTVTASGTALFDGLADATSVGGTNVDFTAPGAAQAAGVDLVDALIAPLPDGEGLRFIWKVSGLPAQSPPETVRYTWSFAVAGKEYQLQAKRTNLVATTVIDDPAGHVGASAGDGAFQLRGDCGPLAGQVATVTSCPHLTFLAGGFDPAASTVHIDVPFGLPAIPGFEPGAVVSEAQTANMSIATGFSAGISNTQTSDYTNGWEPYYTGGTVSIATGAATANPKNLQYRPTSLDGESWTGTLSSPLTHTTLFVRSCEGGSSDCAYVSAPIG